MNADFLQDCPPQLIFDTVLVRLRAQGGASEGLFYRNPFTGRRCAIGCLTRLAAEYEGRHFSAFIPSGPNDELLEALRLAHDELGDLSDAEFLPQWEASMQRIAAQFYLVYTPPRSAPA